MIKLEELNKHNYNTTPEIDTNLTTLLERINKVRVAWAKSMIVTSGLRSQRQQQVLIEQGKSNAPKSHHLTGEAVDILDMDGSLYDWCKANETLLAEIELWMEERMGGWVHFQTVPPKSGHRWFFP